MKRIHCLTIGRCKDDPRIVGRDKRFLVCYHSRDNNRATVNVVQTVPPVWNALQDASELDGKERNVDVRLIDCETSGSISFPDSMLFV